MIVLKEVLKMLSQHGWSAYRLNKEHVISNGTLSQIRAGRPITTATIDTICRLCDCQPGDFMQYVKEGGDE